MKRQIILIGVFISLISCNTGNMGLYKILKNQSVSKIDITRESKEEKRVTIEDKQNIQEFISAFKKNKGKIVKANNDFKVDGKIVFYVEKNQPITVLYDLQQGIMYDLKGKTKYEPFPYQSGRILVEYLNIDNIDHD